MKKVKQAVAIIATALVLSGCGDLKALPDEERYQFINKVKDDLDYRSAGKIIDEKYDGTEGIISPSSFAVNIEGEKAFIELKDRIKNISGATNCNEGMTQITCEKGQVEILLSHNKTSSSKVFLRILDSQSGRVSK